MAFDLNPCQNTYISEFVDVPGVVFAGVVAWEVGGGGVGDGLGGDAYDLCAASIQ